MTLTARIIEACDTSGGLSLAELAEAVNDTPDNVNTIAGILHRDGRLFRAGIKRYYRYFLSKAHADAWDLVAEGVYNAAMAESAERKRLAKNERQRKREKQMTIEGTRPPKKQVKPSAQALRNKAIKRSKLSKRSRGQQENRVAITVAANSGSAFRPDAKVIWPESVRVQVIPTAIDTRFRFIPPSNDWKGEISRDWMEQRLKGVQA